MRRAVIVGGADILQPERIREQLRVDDFVIYCDSGLRYREILGRTPDLIVGDFDSHEDPQLPVETLRLPEEKDDTDTVYAARVALDRGFTDFLLLGVLGGRIDHSLGNLALLHELQQQGAHAVILDDYSRVTLVDKATHLKDDARYFSLFAWGGEVTGLTIRGAKYPLDTAKLTPSQALGVSNEVLPGKTATITLESGTLLVIEVFRDAGD